MYPDTRELTFATGGRNRMISMGYFFRFVYQQRSSLARGWQGMACATTTSCARPPHRRAVWLSYHSPARARRIAGLSGFLTLSQSRDGPDR
jgi:hypothetical protein